MIVGYLLKERAVFLVGFAKNEQENIEKNELLSLREIAQRWLCADPVSLDREISLGNLQEIHYDEEAE